MPSIRTNGLHPPHDSWQRISWGLFVFLVGGFYTVIIPQFDFIFQLILGGIFGFLVLIVVYMVYLTSSTHPFDLYGRSRICNICRKTVRISSTHCHTCGRCVERFSHHCSLLNICIGRKNKRIYLVLVLITFVTSTLELSMFSDNVMRFLGNREAYSDQLNLVYGKEANSLAFFVSSCVCIGLLLPIAWLLGWECYKRPILWGLDELRLINRIPEPMLWDLEGERSANIASFDHLQGQRQRSLQLIWPSSVGGVSQSVKARLQHIHLNEASPSEHEAYLSEVCSICQDDIVLSETITCLDCSHFFHSNCLDEWIKNHHTCPLCQLNLNTQNDIEGTENDLASLNSSEYNERV